ncbi:hypothetical protein C2E23DRAFT_730482 [Lenzites betulinus]|nr:hypothetical protein C2E23DRAFT_730482 [Lenzites betulinus]
MSSETRTTSHREVLGLPSDFTATERSSLELEVLAEYELNLRIGQVFDQLEAVRQAVKHLAAYVEQKKELGHTTKDNMRSNDISKFARVHCEQAARRYNYIFDRIKVLQNSASPVLDDPSSPASQLCRIDYQSDLTITNLKVAREKGDSRHSGSWIWHAFEAAADSAQAQRRSKRLQASAQTDTIDRAQWFRAWKEKVRHDEAVNILCADFRATMRGYSKMAVLWLEAANRPDHSDGSRAYTYQHHALFMRMHDDCEAAFSESRRHGISADTLDQSEVSRPFPSEHTWIRLIHSAVDSTTFEGAST